MNWVGIILATLLVGLIAGLLARAIVPGEDPMSIFRTILLGIIGSIAGVGIASILKLESALLIWVVMIGGAVMALVIYNRIVGRQPAP